MANSESCDTFDDSKLDFDPLAYLESKMNPFKGSKPALPPKAKSDAFQSTKNSGTSVVLPVLHIEGIYTRQKHTTKVELIKINERAVWRGFSLC